MTFVCLVLIEFFKAYNFRSDRHSVLRRPFANKWLNIAIVWELVMLGLILYVPLLERPSAPMGCRRGIGCSSSPRPSPFRPYSNWRSGRSGAGGLANYTRSCALSCTEYERETGRART